jgi:hypothetical protein
VSRVDQGFAYNGVSASIESFSTSYPVLTTKVGAVNKAVFKIYEDGGPSRIRHLDFAFGLSHAQAFSDSKVIIEWSKSWDGIESTKVIDLAHALKDVKVVTSEGPCKTGSIKNDCLIVTIYHTFAAPLEFNGVATNIWDENRNAWQNILTNGIIVLGDSQNPAAKHTVADSTGHVRTITELTSHVATDELGKYWSLDKNGFWVRAFTSPGQIGVLSYWTGYDRNDITEYMQMKKGQALIASKTWDSSKIQTKMAPIKDKIPYLTEKRESLKFEQTKIGQNMIAKGTWDSSKIQNHKPAIKDAVSHMIDNRDTVAFEKTKKGQEQIAKGTWDSSRIQN